ncbi:serine-rich adhesin for platelets-like [Watersipora subatra]|uniref:serine-rich adhesin for platelets-like n=1 Tax=Watersipora subatra TaxID=2589382 RepID=UPI00355BCF18
MLSYTLPTRTRATHCQQQLSNNNNNVNCSHCERWEWVEIIEPRTRERMYANLSTGECVWEPPRGVSVKKTHENQWWELYDQNTDRYYYYNATSQKTVWHRPSNCDIIPLAKLQTMKLSAVGSQAVPQLPAPSKHSSSIGAQTPEQRVRTPKVDQNNRARSSQSSPVTSRRRTTHHRNPHHKTTTATFDQVDQLINGGEGCQPNPYQSSGRLSQAESRRRGSLPTSTPSKQSTAWGTNSPTHSYTPSHQPFTRDSASRSSGQGHDRRDRPKRSTSDHSNALSTSTKQAPPLKRSESFDKQAVQMPGRPSVDYHMLHSGSLRVPSISRYNDPYTRAISTSNHDGSPRSSHRQSPTLLSSSVPTSSAVPARPRLGVKALPRTNPSYRSPMVQHSSREQAVKSDPAAFMRKSSEECNVRQTSDGNLSRYRRESYSSQGSVRELSHTPHIALSDLADSHRSKTLTTSSPSKTSNKDSHTKDLSYPTSAALELRGDMSQGASRIRIDSDRATYINVEHEEGDYENAPNIRGRIQRQTSETQRHTVGETRDELESSDSSLDKMVFVQPIARVSSEANKLLVNKVEKIEVQKPRSYSSGSSSTQPHSRTDIVYVSKQAKVKEIPSTAMYSSSVTVTDEPSDSGSPVQHRTPSQPSLTTDRTKALDYETLDFTSQVLSKQADSADTKTTNLSESFSSSPSSVHKELSSLVVPREGGKWNGKMDINHEIESSDSLSDDKRSSHSSSLASLSNVVAPCGSLEDLNHIDAEVFPLIPDSPTSAPAKNRQIKSDTTDVELPLTSVLATGNGDTSDLMRDITMSLDKALSMDKVMSRGSNRGTVAALSMPTEITLDHPPSIDVKKEMESRTERTSSEEDVGTETPTAPVFSVLSYNEGRVAFNFNDSLSSKKTSQSWDSADHDYVNISEGKEQAGNKVVMRHKNLQKSASTSNTASPLTNVAHYSDSTSDSNKSARVLCDRHNLPSKERPALHHSFSESKGRPSSMLIDNSPPASMKGLHRQHTFAVGTHSKATSLSRGIDIKKMNNEVLLDWYVADQCLSKPKKGLFGKKLTPEMMLSWTQEAINKPMLKTEDKNLRKEAVETFKLIQMYMGDRKAKQISTHTALSIANKGWSITGLRDEIFLQLIRQTSDNPKEESMNRGWELLAICLAFFPPSQKFNAIVEAYIVKHLQETDSDTNFVLHFVGSQVVPIGHYAHICKRRLDRICTAGARKGLKKPTLEEIEQAKRSIFHPSMFGDTLEEILSMQKTKFPERRLPWIQTTLSEEVLKLTGAQTEGIFRVPADMDEVNALKVKFDHWEMPTDLSDPHVLASLLKLWYRELYEPIIPPSYYERCMESCDNPEEAISIIDSLPDINRLCLAYLIRFLQVFAGPDNVIVTKMDINNLAMVMAPNCLRCESEDPRIIIENTRKEMQFIRTLITHMDTSFMEGVI